ncbi:hypothetical protein NDU88_007115 [Pleurodeles waltl]|uniref:Uncharacterized protein n=1 Tax=Pleurodeles waltl TaxID=8319 RepID=A0AAV7SRN2_PLEWA|nr:hypothetical protein NDU88_007115 [Pleurodeles waltl]
MEINPVVQALKVLQEAGREDLIREGVLEQAWVGLRRPKRPSSDRVSAAVLACKSPVTSPKKGKKFKVKSVAGRKVSFSPDHGSEEPRVSNEGGLPGIGAARRGEASNARRYGGFLARRVAAKGRGARVGGDGSAAGKTVGRGSRARSGTGAGRLRGAMRTRGQKGAGAARASLAKGARAHQVLSPRAPLAVESEWEQEGLPFEEGQLGGAAKMAAPSDLKDLSVGEGNLMNFGVEEENFPSGEGSHMFMATRDNKAVIVIDSEVEGEVLELQVEEGSGIGGHSERGFLVPSGGGSRQTSNILCQVGLGVQEWEVEDHSIFRAGGRGFFRKEQGRISQGSICGAALECGGAGSAHLGQKVLGHEQRAYLSECAAPHVSSGHGVLIEHQRSGRSAGGPVSVGVRAPPGRRTEGRAQSGAVRLTAREVTTMEVRSVESNARGSESRSYSRSAMLTGEEEEELDYDEDVEQVEAPQGSTSGQAFRGERLSRRDVAANLSRGKGCVLGGTRSELRVSTNVDVAIQAGGEGIESKVGDPMSAQEESETLTDQTCNLKSVNAVPKGFTSFRIGYKDKCSVGIVIIKTA